MMCLFRLLAVFLVTLSLATSVASAAPVTFDWAQVGNSGNAADPQTGRGAVAYNYAISKTEVTNTQYAAFLNAVNPTGSNVWGLYKTGNFYGLYGIEDTGTAPGARYVAKAGHEQTPVTYVTFFDAMRFTNWLHNGQGTGDTETGAYTIGTSHTHGSGYDEVRTSGAKYWIPSDDEWYKAAYHDASAGTAGVYFDYATGSNSIPVSDRPGDNPSAVNYYKHDGVVDGFNDGYAVNGSTGIDYRISMLTDVGAYTAAASPYGTFDQNGNVREWTEGVTLSYSGVPNELDPYRNLRGGSWLLQSSSLVADRWGTNWASDADHYSGFRLATIAIPEPTALTLAAMLAGWRMLAGRKAPPPGAWTD